MDHPYQGCLLESRPPPYGVLFPRRFTHRPGRPAKLDTDAELRAFVMARVDRLTFEEIAAEIALQYPVERRVAKSSIHQWRRKHEARLTRSSGPEPK